MYITSRNTQDKASEQYHVSTCAKEPTMEAAVYLIFYIRLVQRESIS